LRQHEFLSPKVQRRKIQDLTPRQAGSPLLTPIAPRCEKVGSMKPLPFSASRVIALLLATLLTSANRTPAQQPPASESPKSIAAQLQPFVDGHTLAGAVTLVASKDKVLDVETVGYMDVAAKKPMRPDALFWIASQSKAITAAGLMMLADEGKVNVDDPVEKYLPEFKGQRVVKEEDKDHTLLETPEHPITVKNVLSHTSGLPFKSPIEAPTLDVLPLETRVRSYAMLPLQFEPDTKYQYSNAGINTAGRIIEVVSGMPYEEFLQKRLFDPLGMKDTTFWPNDEQLTRLAKAYKPNAAKNDLEETPIAQLKYPLNDRTRQPMPAGGLFSTAADVARFCQMLLNGGVFEGKHYLSEAAVKQMTSRQTAPEINQSYGFGLSVSEHGFGHGGAYSTNMSVDTQKGLVTVYLVQHAGYPNGDEGKKIQPTFQKAASAFAKPQ
jgi:CubicO group peptidase (beta-lactamase class C family)